MIGEGPTPPPPTKYELFEDENMRTGAKWGSIAGFVCANLIIAGNSPMGFYNGSVFLLFGGCIGVGLLAGLTWGWHYSHQRRQDGEF